MYRLDFKGLTDAEINTRYRSRVSTIANIGKFHRNRIFMVERS